jgi:YHS domain-containing protein
MKKFILLPFALLGAASLLIAADKPADKPAAEQKTCPVSGKPINKDKLVEHEGEKIYFCCGGCADKFKSEPIDFLPAYYRQVYPQSVQTRCPLSGKPVDAETQAQVDGKTVAFCCPGCAGKYKAEPAKYTEKLKAASTKQVHCPVSGKAIDPAVSAEKGDKTVYFCCKGCAKKVSEDEKAFADAAAEDQGVLAYGPEAKKDVILCPVCAGMASTRGEMKRHVHEGKAYYFCASHCLEVFKKDPAKYQKQLEENVKKAEKKDAA